MTAEMVRVIDAALDQGHRVQLKKLKDGTIKMQAVLMKELKVNTVPTAQSGAGKS